MKNELVLKDAGGSLMKTKESLCKGEAKWEIREVIFTKHRAPIRHNKSIKDVQLSVEKDKIWRL